MLDRDQFWNVLVVVGTITEVVRHGSRAVPIDDDARQAQTRRYTSPDEVCNLLHGRLQADFWIANPAASVVPSALTLGVNELVHPGRSHSLERLSRREAAEPAANALCR